MGLPVNSGAETMPAFMSSIALASQGVPLITYYDDATGERVDLSAETLRTWATRTANLLAREYGLGPGTNAALLLPPHWQTAAIVLGAWSVGVSLGFQISATAGLAPAGQAAHAPIHATFASLDRIRDMTERVPPAPIQIVLGFAPEAAPMTNVPEGYRDFIPAVSVHSGTVHPNTALRGSDLASIDGTTFTEWGSLAGAMADMWNLKRGDRVLVDAAKFEHPLKWLLAPLSVGATIVLCSNLDPTAVAARSQQERVTRVL